MTGLKTALAYAEPNSIAYVFTDAGAKDHHLYKEVLSLVQKKQVKVNFITAKIDPSKNPLKTVVVYHQIAQASEGQVLIINRNSIMKLLLSISESLDSKYEALASINSKQAGKISAVVRVDASFTKISVTLAGESSTLVVKKQNNETITGSSSDIISVNVQFTTFNVTDTVYNIEASARSSYSIRVGGISDLKILFGFSTHVPSNHAETSFRPLVGAENILSVFVSDPSLVKGLTNAVIIPAVEEDPFEDIDITFTSVCGNMYSSALFKVPTKMFKVKVQGCDKNGNEINRLISSGIESVTGGQESFTNLYCRRSLLSNFLHRKARSKNKSQPLSYKSV